MLTPVYLSSLPRRFGILLFCLSLFGLVHGIPHTWGRWTLLALVLAVTCSIGSLLLLRSTENQSWLWLGGGSTLAALVLAYDLIVSS
ncbi:hypothetical protein GCM10022625_36380 [Deinococcus aetherius]